MIINHLEIIRISIVHNQDDSWISVSEVFFWTVDRSLKGAMNGDSLQGFFRSAHLSFVTAKALYLSCGVYSKVGVGGT